MNSIIPGSIFANFVLIRSYINENGKQCNILTYENKKKRKSSRDMTDSPKPWY